MESAQLAETILAATRNTACPDLRLDLLEASVRYARLRAEWAITPVPRWTPQIRPPIDTAKPATTPVR